MVDQNPQSAAPLRPIEIYAAATRELAESLRFLGEMIRQSAPVELEWVPCEEQQVGDDADDEGDDSETDRSGVGSGPHEAESTSRPTLLAVTPVQPSSDPQPAELCRPGGCGCGQREPGEGRHARRDEVDPVASPAGAQ